MGTLRVFGGALTHFLCKLRLRFFSPPWGGRCTHCTPWLRLCKLRPCLLYYFALRRRRGIKQSCDPSVCLSVCLPHASRAKTVHSRHMVTERPWPWEICVVKVSKTKKKYRLPIICNNHLTTRKDRTWLLIFSCHLSMVKCHHQSGRGACNVTDGLHLFTCFKFVTTTVNLTLSVTQNKYAITL